MSESGGNYEKPKLTETSLPKIVAKLKATDEYKILGVKRGATEAQIRSAFRERSRERHPDKARTEADRKLRQELIAETNVARDTLMDAGKRGVGKNPKNSQVRTPENWMDMMFTDWGVNSPGYRANQEAKTDQEKKGAEAGAARGEAVAWWQYSDEGIAEKNRIFDQLQKTLEGGNVSSFMSDWIQGRINERSDKKYKIAEKLIAGGKLGVSASQMRDLATACVLAKEYRTSDGLISYMPGWVEGIELQNTDFRSSYGQEFKAAWARSLNAYVDRVRQRVEADNLKQLKEYEQRMKEKELETREAGTKWGSEVANVFFDPRERTKTMALLQGIAKRKKWSVKSILKSLDEDGVRGFGNQDMEFMVNPLGSGSREEQLSEMRIRLHRLEAARRYVMRGDIYSDPTFTVLNSRYGEFNAGFELGWKARAEIGLDKQTRERFAFIPPLVK